MNKKKLWKILRKQFALFAIYLIISLVFFTAKGMAELSYSVQGDAGAEGFARKTGDIGLLTVNANSNVSFVTGIGTENYREIPLECSGTSTAVSCFAKLTDLESVNVNDMAFTLKQVSGVPITKNGVLHIDSMAPVSNIDIAQMATKTGSGLSFNYDFIDYQASTDEAICEGSGIASIEFIVNGKSYLLNNFTERTCNATGQYFVNLSNYNINYGGTIEYYVIATDRVGNKYSTEIMNTSGDFKPPKVDKTFKIMRDGSQVISFSSASPVSADIVITVEDSALGENGVYADLTMLNTNPMFSMDPTYKNFPAACVIINGSRTVYTCTFNGVYVQPGKAELAILVIATDKEGNNITQASKAVVDLKNSAGSVLFLGPDKSHCTADLSQCYLKNGTQRLLTEIDATSNYNHSIINLGVNGEKRFAICRLNSTWKCIGVYNIGDDTSLDLVISESYDDYGNSLESGVQRTITIDNIMPVNTTSLTIGNTNNNVGCSASGDQLTLKVKVQEATPELKIYINSSIFTSKEVQTGKCEQTGSDWECTLIVKDFVSYVVSPLVRNVIVEDLAGNKLPLPYTFEVCKAVSTGTPNVIFGAQQVGTPHIDRKIASLIPVQVFIPLKFNVPQASDKIMYMTIDRCIANDINGMNVIGPGPYILPTYQADTNTLALKIGKEDALLPLGTLLINCTVSARIRSGSTIFVVSEKEQIELKVTTFNQPLGTLDAATTEEILVQKQALRDLDERISKAEGILKLLNGICKLSDILVKINGILQTLKAVLNVVCIILYNIPYTKGLGTSLWILVDTVTSTYDDVVIQRFIWPTGECTRKGVPTPQKCVVGWIMKYACFAYTCKIYTLSGIMEVVSDSATAIKAINAARADNLLKDTKVITDKETGSYTGELRDGTQIKVENVKDGDTLKSQTITKTSADGTTSIDVRVDGVRTSLVTDDGTIKTSTQYDANGKVTNIERTGFVSNPNHVPLDQQPLPTTRDEEIDLQTNSKYNSIVSQKTTTTYTGNGNYEVKVFNDGVQVSSNTYVTPTDSKSRFGFFSTTYDRKGTDGPARIIQTNYGATYTIERDVDKSINRGKDVFTMTSDTNPYAGESEALGWDMFDDTTTASREREAVLYDAIDSTDWILNPYKSQEYDVLCIPATKYNMKKERQIRCMYLTCLLESQVNGLPTNVCKDVYSVNNCLYLESAQHRLDGGPGKQFLSGLTKLAIMMAMGWAVQKVYSWLCENTSDKKSKEPQEPLAFRHIGCGLFSAGLKWQEIKKMFQSPEEVMKDLFKGSMPEDPASIHDYCDGGNLYAYDEE